LFLPFYIRLEDSESIDFLPWSCLVYNLISCHHESILTVSLSHKKKLQKLALGPSGYQTEEERCEA
jgi:hypothetical protein